MTEGNAESSGPLRKRRHDPRTVIVRFASADPEDADRYERLVSLLSNGFERILNGTADTPLDFRSNVSNECDGNQSSDTPKA